MADEIVEWTIPKHPLATLVDAEHALKNIAVAEAGETLWAQAKDASKMFEAVTMKLVNQAAYAVWRSNVAKPGGNGSNQHQRAILSEQKELLPAADPGDMVVHRWRQRLCKKLAPNIWCVDNDKFTIVFEDVVRRCVRICEQEKDGTIRGTEGTGEFERYTPAEYIGLARDVLGTIDLDPASSEYAQRTVQATAYFTVEDNGLARDWHGRVWLNPPYHRELAPRFIDKLVAELAAGRVSQAIVLTNNSTDTEWFLTAARVCDAICFTTGRIKFEVPDRDPVLPTQGQAFFYFGPGVKGFIKVFSAIGWCVEPA